MPKLMALIFDLDGTLVDSAGDLRQAVNTVLAAHGRAALSLGDIKNMVGDGLRILLHRAFASTGEALPEAAERAAMDDLLRAYQTQKASRDMLYPLAEEMLAGFRARQIKIGLCTNKLYLPTLKLLDDIGIAGLFDFIAGSDTFPVFKPDPGHVLGVARALKTPPGHCVMIGDSANDINAARGAGIASIAVGHGYGRDVGTLGADAVIGGFGELAGALTRLGFDIGG
ncbi:MAG: HAD-IA family hydrolase [Alphaproteobacteria bacterium]|nr:HAD-IA family hydrolase [Alphaproteobacteria bacterium]